jgi:uncharacterized protein (DUF1697 family)
MTELARLCESAGFCRVRTFIQSGNVVFQSLLDENAAKATLEKTLAAKMGRPFTALIRTAEELENAIERNPFKDMLPNHVIVVFYDAILPESLAVEWNAPGGEQLHVLGRELYVHYPNGQGVSKLKLPRAELGTGRNINTLKRLAEMARELHD